MLVCVFGCRFQTLCGDLKISLRCTGESRLVVGASLCVSLFRGCECLFNDDQYYHKPIASMVVVIVAVLIVVVDVAVVVDVWPFLFDFSHCGFGCMCVCVSVCLSIRCRWTTCEMYTKPIQTMEFTVTHNQTKIKCFDFTQSRSADVR